MLDWVLNIAYAVLNLSNHGLGKGSDFILHGRFYLVKLVPELLLHCRHIAPCVHPVGLNISYFLLEILLLLFITLDVFLKIGFLWPFDDDRGDFLRSLHLMNIYVLLEPQLDDF